MADRISREDLAALLERIFVRHGVREAAARVLAANCAGCEADGSHSHGVFRMTGYVSSLDVGWVDGAAVPVVEEAGPSFLRVDAMNGFAQPALAAARARFVQMVRDSGIALLAIRNSHHLSALWPDIEPFAEEGIVALSMVNSMACAVPFDATGPVFGTNPLAMSAPRGDGRTISFDLATTTMAHGDVQLAAREGRAVPEGTGLDAKGRPTTDPHAILKGGALLPFGGHKGASIALMVELLCAGLTGGNFSFEFDLAGTPGAHTPHTGQLIIGIDANRAGGAPFVERAEALIARMQAEGLTRLPGERRYRTREDTARNGIPLDPEVLANLREMAG